MFCTSRAITSQYLSSCNCTPKSTFNIFGAICTPNMQLYPKYIKSAVIEQAGAALGQSTGEHASHTTKYFNTGL